MFPAFERRSPGPDERQGAFSGDPRRNVRDGAWIPSISEGGESAASHIFDHVRRRHEERGTFYRATTAFVTD